MGWRGTMRILLVEDNTKLAEGTRDVLTSSGFQVDIVANGEDAQSALRAGDYDLVILDLTLPDMDGLDVLRALRGHGGQMPVLIITARGDLDDRVKGLDLGADDYLTKPFEVSELEARVRALIRRSAGRTQSSLTYAGLTLDIANGILMKGNEPLEITPREFATFRALVLSKSDVVPKVKILNSLTTFDSDITENAVEQIISRLRKRLAPHGISIRTARGIGYYLFTQEAQ